MSMAGRRPNSRSQPGLVARQGPGTLLQRVDEIAQKKGRLHSGRLSEGSVGFQNRRKELVSRWRSLAGGKLTMCYFISLFLMKIFGCAFGIFANVGDLFETLLTSTSGL